MVPGQEAENVMLIHNASEAKFVLERYDQGCNRWGGLGGWAPHFLGWGARNGKCPPLFRGQAPQFLRYVYNCFGREKKIFEFVQRFLKKLTELQSRTESGGALEKGRGALKKIFWVLRALIGFWAPHFSKPCYTAGHGVCRSVIWKQGKASLHAREGKGECRFVCEWSASYAHQGLWKPAAKQLCIPTRWHTSLFVSPERGWTQDCAGGGNLGRLATKGYQPGCASIPEEATGVHLSRWRSLWTPTQIESAASTNGPFQGQKSIQKEMSACWISFVNLVFWIFS